MCCVDGFLQDLRSPKEVNEHEETMHQHSNSRDQDDHTIDSKEQECKSSLW